MQRIGMLTIGQSPREDILTGMRPYLTHAVEMVQRGALDDIGAPRTRPTGPSRRVMVAQMVDGLL